MLRSNELTVKKRFREKTENRLKGLVLSFVSRLSSGFDIDRDVSTAHCRSSSGDSVDLLSRTICSTVVVSDWCITNLAHAVGARGSYSIYP